MKCAVIAIAGKLSLTDVVSLAPNDGAMCPVGITKHVFVKLYKTKLDAERITYR